MLFTGGALLTGATAYSALGLVGTFLGGSFLFRPIAVAWLLGTVIWYLTGSRRVPFGRASVQARRDLALRSAPGLVYFGALLGVGLLTQMSTPLVYGGALLALASGPMVGLAYGAAFGVGRSLPAWGGAILAGRWDPSTVSHGLIERGSLIGRLGGLAASAFLVAMAFGG